MKFMRTETLKNSKTAYIIYPGTSGEESNLLDFLDEQNACIGKEE